MTRDVWILEGVRTPFGRHGGALASVRPDDLAAAVIAELLRRVPGIDPARIDDVVFGDANGAGEDNRNVARMAALLAGLPPQVPGATVNRLCASGMEAVVAASRQIAVGDGDVCVAGGVESMSRAPWVMLKPERGFARDHQTMHSTTLGWRMVNPRMPARWTVSLGEGAEILAERYGLGREAQDEFAVRSHRRAAAAWEACRFADEVVPVSGAMLAPAAGARAAEPPPGEQRGPLLERDECVRPASIETLAALPPAFRSGGTVTAGNSSPLNDGAAALLLVTEDAGSAAGREPLARIAGHGVSGVEPHLYGLGPVEAARTALRRAGIGWGDLGVVELNEAFAAQSLACLAEWPELDPDLVNPNGGAIAIGHPLGCSGARLVLTLARELRRRGGGWGLAAMCIGVGQGEALVLRA